ncbi:C-terminal processing protease CtpA/Prc, contains a PDZ domain [Flavobacterium glycines]|uniref:C-terminal processing protease CtpA/Prc, contains a PDZ domain n=1 Tax=Flavobacterium glycines TaxID=551990 RepID=A0A1B9DJF1_9FLAO|nr:S41 family peptidase [Flavobacterium glycines]OCB69820.1 peptidase S41 [Flavobacterium glycines]SDJ90084.1 C-terminal processing protease CtpA/Prc, contains a PDZ domain [Flavobacterium glycines]
MLTILFLKKRIPQLLLAFFLVQCSTIKKDNVRLQQLIPANALQKDVDFAHKKLQKLHPNLDYYISKENLNNQFDSVKKTINKALTPLEFYKKISPVVAAVKQGHSYVLPPQKAYTKRETKSITKKGIGPFSQFDFTYYNDKLYVVRNKSYNKEIAAGTEVLSINGIKPQELINEYSHYFSSDGFNTTFKKELAAKRFVSYFTIENDIKDSLHYVFKYNDSIKNITIKRFKLDSLDLKTKKIRQKKVVIDKAKQRILEKKKRINGFDKNTNTFIRELHFISKDSSIALLKIRGFKDGRFRKFYKMCFAELQKRKTKTLIIDLRNNGGGRLSEIVHLYSYLADSSSIFLKKTEVVSRASLFEGVYFNKGNAVVKTIKTLFSPIVYSYLLLTVHKEKDGKNYFDTETKPQPINEKAFKGKLYVLINGGSFSASSILSTNLKGSKRATFVGEETGGDYNGTVAGFMPIVKLPHSKLNLRIGTMNFTPFYQSPVHGRGIFPDVTIIPTLEDQIRGNDPELDWILKQQP